jgi:hypothetical protein
VLDLSGGLNVSGGGIRELNPILEKVIVYPVDVLIHTLTAALVRPVAAFLFCLVKDSFNDPVVFLDAVKFAPESKSCGSTES